MGYRDGVNSYTYAGDSPAIALDSTGLSFYIDLDTPATPRKCQLLTLLLRGAAVGRNQDLLDYWLSGKAGSFAVPWNYFDAGDNLPRELGIATQKAWRLGKEARCNESVLSRYSLSEPKGSNRYTYITYMIFGWRFWFNCDLEAKKNCDEKGCCKSISTRIHCRFNAHDTVDFWKQQSKTFPIPPFEVHDRLVSACFPMGRGFQVHAEVDVSGSWVERGCDSQFPIDLDK